MLFISDKGVTAGNSKSITEIGLFLKPLGRERWNVLQPFVNQVLICSGRFCYNDSPIPPWAPASGSASPPSLRWRDHTLLLPMMFVLLRPDLCLGLQLCVVLSIQRVSFDEEEAEEERYHTTRRKEVVDVVDSQGYSTVGTLILETKPANACSTYCKLPVLDLVEPQSTPSSTGFEWGL